MYIYIPLLHYRCRCCIYMGAAAAVVVDVDAVGAAVAAAAVTDDTIYSTATVCMLLLQLL